MKYMMLFPGLGLILFCGCQKPLNQGQIECGIYTAVSEVRPAQHIEALPQQSDTPLHSAASGSNEKIIEMLLDAGAQVNPVTEEGRTPLDMAEPTNRCGPEKVQVEKIVECLARHGAKHAAELD
jgi:hypothetical protein